MTGRSVFNTPCCSLLTALFPPLQGITVDNLLETVSGFGDAAEQIINRVRTP